MEGRFGRMAGGGGTAIGLVRACGRVLFPHFCLDCGREGSLLCGKCEDRNALQEGVLFCLRCGRVMRSGSLCPRRRCRQAGAGWGLSAGRYGDPARRGLLQLYKYEGVREAGETTMRLFLRGAARHASAVLAADESPVVVPVPMHPVNQALRGFSQSEELAAALAADFELELVADAIERRFAWRAQARLSGPRRRASNVSRAFRPGRGSGAVSARSVVLVDDVFTTGATVRGCIEALRAAGAAGVTVVTALKG